jgi:hypothetical protein
LIWNEDKVGATFHIGQKWPVTNPCRPTPLPPRSPGWPAAMHADMSLGETRLHPLARWLERAVEGLIGLGAMVVLVSIYAMLWF